MTNNPLHASRNRRNSLGVTLVEVLIALVILAMTIGVVGSGVSGLLARIKFEQRRNMARMFFQRRFVTLQNEDLHLGTRSGAFDSKWPGVKWQEELKQAVHQDRIIPDTYALKLTITLPVGTLKEHFSWDTFISPLAPSSTETAQLPWEGVRNF